jgi:hypothetical protein
VLTLFSIPKPFEGDIAELQGNALSSWAALGPSVQVVLVGDEPGVAEAAAAVGADHVEHVARSDRGTPRLDDAFRGVDTVARHPLRCFVNADVVFLDDFLPAVTRLGSWREPWLAVGRTLDVRLPPAVTSRPGWRDEVRRAAPRGVRRGAAAVDWFVFQRELFVGMPPFVVGRAAFDNWMLWHVRAQHLPVVDLTGDVLSIHQSHGYGHLPGGKHEAYWGPEAQRNRELAGRGTSVYSICDATHRLQGGEVRRNPSAFLRAGEMLRRVRWKLGRERTP